MFISSKSKINPLTGVALIIVMLTQPVELGGAASQLNLPVRISLRDILRDKD